MLPYQEQYIQNAEEICAIWQFTAPPGQSFGDWYAERMRRRDRLTELKKENAALLSEHLYPALDSLYEADAETLEGLEAFADRLMDWKSNIDCGVYVAIHDALLSMLRFRRDRDGVIRELYKLGMGLYYLNRIVAGLDGRAADAFRFYDEMVFTEAASYLRYFDELGDETTRGYVIRCLANISLCTTDWKKRIGIGMKTLNILRDEGYRASAPSLPWDVFIRRTHQQMSTNRSALNRSSLTKEEIAAVLDSCYEVFKVEEAAANPSVRWLWPYYDMEYSCGYVGLEETVDRLERLISATPDGQYDQPGFYGNAELAIEYGKFLKRYPQLAGDPKRVRFLGYAYGKMMRALTSAPAETWSDYFVYLMTKVYADFYEMDGLISYREVTGRLMPRYSGAHYIRARTAGDMMAAIAGAILAREPDFFDDLPCAAGSDPDGKREAVLTFARDCGLYCDFGLFSMNVERLEQTRPVLESEDERIRLHTVSGYENLRARASTAMFADTARGHHSSYSGDREDDPSGYVRMESPTRLMTDVAAVVTWLMDGEGGVRERVRGMTPREKNRFSPPVLAYLTDPDLCGTLDGILHGSGEVYFREIFDTLTSAETE